MVDRDGKQTIVQNITARTCVVCVWGGISLLEHGPMFVLHFILLCVINCADICTVVCKHSHHSVG